MHSAHGAADAVWIRNNPLYSFIYEARVFRSGNVLYRCTEESADTVFFRIPAVHAQMILDLAASVPAWDPHRPQESGVMLDGSRWTIRLFSGEDCVAEAEGGSGEDDARTETFRRILQGTETLLRHSMGTQYMYTTGGDENNG